MVLGLFCYIRQVAAPCSRVRSTKLCVAPPACITVHDVYSRLRRKPACATFMRPASVRTKKTQLINDRR